MLDLLADFSLGTLASSAGLGAGWLLHRAARGTPVKPPEEQKMARAVLQRLKDLAVHMAAHVGQHNSRVEEINHDLTGREANSPEGVISAVARLIESNHSIQLQLNAVEDKLHEQARLVESKAAEARTDALTGLPNRRAFDDKVAQCVAEFRQISRPFALILGDIDHFKNFNDRHGHQTGDEVLRGVARVLRESACEGNLVARYGGEELAIILPGASADEAIRVEERVRQAIESERFRGSKDAPAAMHVTMSFGVAALRPGEDEKSLLRRADEALYAAKQAGRNRGCWHAGGTIRPIARPCDLASAASRLATSASEGERGQSPFVRSTLRAVPANGDCPRSPAPPAGDACPSAAEYGLCNKDEFVRSLVRRLAEWRRQGPAPALLMMKIDGYAGLVQRHGPDISDVVLRSASQFLAASIRAMDLGSQYGEATFAMLLPGAGPAELIRVAERLRLSVAQSALTLDGRSLKLTASLAAATAMQTDTAEQMLARAEETLATASAAGGNCTFFHTGARAEPVAATIERMKAAAAV